MPHGRNLYFLFLYHFVWLLSHIGGSHFEINDSRFAIKSLRSSEDLNPVMDTLNIMEQVPVIARNNPTLTSFTFIPLSRSSRGNAASYVTKRNVPALPLFHASAFTLQTPSNNGRVITFTETAVSVAHIA